MRISKIKFEESITSSKGLKEIKLERLGSVVALVGKNGSGKSRLLDFIENNFTVSINDFLDFNITMLPSHIQEALNALESYRPYIRKKKEYDSARMKRLINLKDTKLIGDSRKLRVDLTAIIESLDPPSKRAILKPGGNGQLEYKPHTIDEKIRDNSNTVNSYISRLKKDYIKRVDYLQIKQLQEAISDNEEGADSFEKLIENVSDNLEYNEFRSIYSSSLRFLRKLPNQLVSDWIECMGDEKKIEKRAAYRRYITLKGIFDNIFGKNLEWGNLTISKTITENEVQSIQAGFWKIDGREFNYTEFSDGEKSLFAYVLLFFLMSQNKNIRLKESIIIIDEPELHLHPDAEIDLINGIRSIIEDKGQLWIATHSVNILSHLNIDEVFMVRGGQIYHPSKTIQREALSELMKIDERINKLSEFITSISDWTFVNFMIECFTNPEVIEIAKANDPQIKSLKEFIGLEEGSRHKMLLDFGAGRGRLFEQASQDENFNKLIDYSALEPNLEFHSKLKSKGVNHIYSSYEELKEDKFDYVVLCNVLHEIGIDEWIPTLNKIIDSLAPTGSLIIIEAKTLVKGEQIGNIGYLLLNEEEIQILFGLSQKPLSSQNKAEYNNITSVFIPKSDLKPVLINNLKQALDKLQNNCISKIKDLRNTSEPNHNSNKFGRQAAFFSQQFINAKLAVDHLDYKIVKE